MTVELKKSQTERRLKILADILQSKTLKAVADKHGLSATRIRQIGHRATRQLRALLHQSPEYSQAVGLGSKLIVVDHLELMRQFTDSFLKAIELYPAYNEKYLLATNNLRIRDETFRLTLRRLCRKRPALTNQVVILNNRFEVISEAKVSDYGICEHLVEHRVYDSNLPVFVNGGLLLEGNITPKALRLWDWLLTAELKGTLTI